MCFAHLLVVILHTALENGSILCVHTAPNSDALTFVNLPSAAQAKATLAVRAHVHLQLIHHA